jgi:hypothetical protein
MAGLGFRPLGYADAGLVEDPFRETWLEFEAVLKNSNKEELAEYIYNNKPTLDMIAEQNPARAQMYEEAKAWSEFNAFMKKIMPSDQPGQIPLGEKLGNLGRISGAPTATGAGAPNGLSDLITQAEIEYKERGGRGRQGVYEDALAANSFEEFRRMQPTIGVSEAGWQALRLGETLSEDTPEWLGSPPYQDMETTRGLYPGGDETSNPWNPTTQAEQSFRENVLGDRGVLYGDITPRLQGGGYVGRGTVAGELPDYGDMSVRVKGESMQELAKRHKERLAKRHKERDWYSKDKMGGGLGSLGPLRRDRRMA